MWEIISFLGGLKNLAIGGFFALIALFGWWQKKKITSQANTIERQSNALETYKTEDEIVKEDSKIDTETENKIDNIENKLTGDPKEDATIVSEGLNDFFRKSDK
jgi:hypothetical protein